MLRSQLNSYSGSDPIWGFVALVGTERFTGEAAVGLDPRVRLFAVDGRVYFAEREGDAPIGTRLVNCGVLSAAQLEQGSVRVGDAVSLGRLFQRQPAVDRDAVELTIELATDSLLESIANKPVGMPEVFPLRHHPAGIHQWMRPTATVAGVTAELATQPVEEHLAEPVAELLQEDAAAETDEVEQAGEELADLEVGVEHVVEVDTVVEDAPATEDAIVEDAPATEDTIVDDTIVEDAPAAEDAPTVDDSPVVMPSTFTMLTPLVLLTQAPVVDTEADTQPAIAESAPGDEPAASDAIDAIDSLDAIEDTTPIAEEPVDEMLAFEEALAFEGRVADPAEEPTAAEAATSEHGSAAAPVGEQPAPFAPLLHTPPSLTPWPDNELTAEFAVDTSPADEADIAEPPEAATLDAGSSGHHHDNGLDTGAHGNDPDIDHDHDHGIDHDHDHDHGAVSHALALPAPVPSDDQPSQAMPLLASLSMLQPLAATSEPDELPALPKLPTLHSSASASELFDSLPEPSMYEPGALPAGLPKLASAPISMDDLVAANADSTQSWSGATHNLAAVEIWEMVDDLIDDGPISGEQLVTSGGNEKRGRGWLRGKKG